MLDADAAVLGRERPEAALGLLELPLEADTVPAAGLVPRDDDVDEPLEEILLPWLRGAPGVFERLVRGEVLAFAGQIQAPVQISRDRL